MLTALMVLLRSIGLICCGHRAIALENLALRQQNMAYYHGARTHLSLEKDSPTPRRIQAPTEGRVAAFAEVGGLH
jgi:hypothetical protein